MHIMVKFNILQNIFQICHLRLERRLLSRITFRKYFKRFDDNILQFNKDETVFKDNI